MTGTTTIASTTADMTTHRNTNEQDFVKHVQDLPSKAQDLVVKIVGYPMALINDKSIMLSALCLNHATLHDPELLQEKSIQDKVSNNQRKSEIPEV